MKALRFDSLIFDMDGTLWDAVDTYAEIWNETYRRMGVDATVARHTLIDCMGMTLDRIFDLIAPAEINRSEFEKTLRTVDSEIMPVEGGRLYEGVRELIPELARHYRLFMVSNCGPHGLDYFFQYTGLGKYFTDSLTHGQTHLPKEGNIRQLIKRHDLTNPIYIGDTEGDCRSAHAAGVAMAHVSYGFGKCTDAELTASSFPDLATIFLNLASNPTI